MTHDITGYDENTQLEDGQIIGEPVPEAPPLCLVQYFAERAGYPPERPAKPPGRRAGRVAERRGNLIILEFGPPSKTPPQWRGGRHGKSLWMRVCDALMLLLLLASLLGCMAAFRY